MAWEKDLTGLDKIKEGTFRSLNGAADENIFIGRASKAGFFCFFKVWRDMPYDAVLDYNGILYRIETKGSSGSSFNVTRGTRSGRQIKKTDSRERVIDRFDCDFVIGVDSNNGDCYVIPTDLIEILDKKNLSKNFLKEYRENWKLLMFDSNYLTKEQTRDGLMNEADAVLDSLVKTLKIVVPKSDIKVPYLQQTYICDSRQKKIYMIWNKIAENLNK